MADVICIAGKNRIALHGLAQCVRRIDQSVLAIPNRDDDGTDGWQPFLLCAARELGDRARVVTLAEAQATKDLLFLLLEFDRIIRPDRFASIKLYNLHFSALSEYKGVYTPCHPLVHGESRSGVTQLRIDAGIDTGAIVAQSLFAFDADETCKSLYERYLDHADLITADAGHS